MIGQFFDTMIIASSDEEWLWWPIKMCWKLLELFWATLITFSSKFLFSTYEFAKIQLQDSVCRFFCVTDFRWKTTFFEIGKKSFLVCKPCSEATPSLFYCKCYSLTLTYWYPCALTQSSRWTGFTCSRESREFHCFEQGRIWQDKWRILWATVVVQLICGGTKLTVSPEDSH